MDRETLSPQSGGERAEVIHTLRDVERLASDIVEWITAHPHSARSYQKDKVRVMMCRSGLVGLAANAELASLRREVESHDDFMAYMTGELSKFACCHEDGRHAGTPPMMWPELIACIVQRAVREALNGSTNPKRSSSTATSVSNPNETTNR